LLDNKGEILLLESISVEYKNHQEIFTNVINTIRENIDAVKSLDLRIIKLGGYFLYLGTNKDFILAVLSAREDDRFLMAINLALRNIRLLQNIDKIKSNVTIREKAKKVIFDSLSNTPPSSRVLLKLADDMIEATPTTDRLKNIGVDKLHLFAVETEIESLRKTSSKEVTMESLIQAFFDGDFSFVVRNAPNIFSKGDLPRIIYAIAALNVNSFDPRVKSPSLGNIKGVVLDIEDPLAREYLLLNILAYFRPIESHKKVEVLMRNKRRLLEKIESEDNIEADVYSLLLSDAPLRDVLSFILKKYSGQSNLLRLRIINRIYAIKTRDENPPHISLWIKMLKKFINYFTEATSKGGESAYHQLMILQRILVWGLSIIDMDPMSIQKEFENFIRYEREYHGRIERKSKFVPNELKANSINITFNVVFRILLDISEDDMNLLIKNNWDIIISLIKWLVALRFKRRIRTDTYQMVVSRLLGLIAKMASERGIYIENVPVLVREMAEYCSAMQTEYDLYTYASVYLGMAESLIYMAKLFPDELRVYFLDELFKALKKFISLLSKRSVLRSIIIIRLLDILSLIENEASQIEGQRIKEKHKEELSFFFREYAEKIMPKIRA